MPHLTLTKPSKISKKSQNVRIFLKAIPSIKGGLDN
jgi:hypothetical protein